jgi:tetratricopeptide (TPR) repeat protein
VAYLLNDDVPLASSPDDPEVPRLVQKLKKGNPAERHVALARLIAKQAEEALVECLASENEVTATLATAGLWECWFNEAGPGARKQLDAVTESMNAGDLGAAEKALDRLMRRYPDWAEAKNKKATLLYLKGEPAASLELCKQVVELKPHHFGAWNGIALCAVQMQHWATAMEAAIAGARLAPSLKANQDILQLAKLKLGIS